MRKTVLLIVAVVSGVFFSASRVHADVIYRPIIPGTSSAVDYMIIGGVVVGFIALISWLVICAIRRKKNVVNK